MTGPEHYREAERMLRLGQAAIADAAASKSKRDINEALEVQAHAAQVAQAHATLALASATAHAAGGAATTALVYGGAQ